jgi:hypothetical protein
MPSDVRSSAPSPRIAALSGALALAVAMGIGRFAFTPILPFMQRDALLDAAGASWLAAANYLGYLLGALSSSRLPVRPSRMVVASLVGTALLTMAMGVTADRLAWIVLRLLAGVLSAWTLVGTSAWALQALATAGRPQWAGLLYAGVGGGIALAGLYCLAAAGPQVPSARLWVGLGIVAALAIAAPVAVLLRHPERDGGLPPAHAGRTAVPAGGPGLIACYGIFGIGYVLPATFLPAMARQMIDDPHVFGLAWPVFGAAAAISTLVVARGFGHVDRRKVWAVTHVLMAAGAVLPTLLLAPLAIGAAALLVGGSFMVATMVGIQEGRALDPAQATTMVGRLTTAFAAGQFAGPAISGLLARFPAARGQSLTLTLWLAAALLVASAAYLWRASSTGGPRDPASHWTYPRGTCATLRPANSREAESLPSGRTLLTHAAIEKNLAPCELAISREHVRAHRHAGGAHLRSSRYPSPWMVLTCWPRGSSFLRRRWM